MSAAPDSWRRAVADALRARGWKGSDELTGRCIEPSHEDASPSATWNAAKGCGGCKGCGASWSCRDAADLLGVDLSRTSAPLRTWP